MESVTAEPMTIIATTNSSAITGRLSDFLQYRIAVKVWRVSLPTLMVVGILGNILNIVVLRRQRYRESPTSQILLLLSISDILCLVIGPTRYVLMFITGKDFTSTSNFYCKTYRFFNYLFTDFSAWLVMLVAIERAVAVGIPHKLRIYFTRLRIYGVALFFASFLAAVNFHFFITYESIQGLNNTQLFSCGVSVHGDHYHFVRYIFPWIDLCVFMIIPVIGVSSCNIFIIIALVVGKYKRMNMIQGGVQPKMTSMTAVMFAISVFLVAAVTPTVVYQFIYPDLFRLQSEGNIEAEVQLFVLAIYSVVAVYGNCAVNVVLYSVCTRKFRAEVMSMFKRKNQVGPVTQDTGARTGSQNTETANVA
ncbi:unnamed protein product [Owenia fusiformis]|uniref:Uncharacterized protein n=1 Tax=Owenia fusiformis TaxID=6347 RepID=A0A8J1U269_OWEFU|nr:unnamed protein product [Owenia fusiformis]